MVQRTSSLLAYVVSLVALVWAPVAALGAGEEFAGPFPSWRDLRRDHGAMGDGQADDTAALQRGLDGLVKHEQACGSIVPW
jgi:hypothetical protein